MFISLLLLLFCSNLIFFVISQNVTFQNVEIQCQTEDNEVFNIFINKTKNLPNELPIDGISRISVVNGIIPVIYPNAFNPLSSLKILQMRQSGIEELKPGAFNNLPVLEILRLNGNKLTKLQNEIFNNLSLIFLNLDNNLIENISSDTFNNLPKLKVLDLSNNKLQIFYSEWLENKPNLSSIFLNYNEIEGLPDNALKNYHNDIDFSNNKIKNISNLIFGLNGKKRIGQLLLNDNHIEKWDENFIRDVEIRVLDFSRNKLKCIDGKFEYYFVAYQTRIDNNPWNCECLLKIGKWLLEHKAKVKMYNSIRNCNLTEKFSQFS